MSTPVIIGGVRTPFVKAGDVARFTSAQELGRLATRELLYRTNVKPDAVDQLIAGSVAGSSNAANIARVIALNAGIPKDRIAHTVNRNCASGFECITQAADQITLGRADVVVAVGVESMSNIPLLWSSDLTEMMLQLARRKGLFGKLKLMAKIRPRHLKPVIGLKLGLTDPVSGMIMGDTAERLAREFDISRAQQDQFALESHQKAVAAWNDKRFDDEVMPMFAEPKRNAVAADIGPRENQSLEALAKLKPYFDRKYGSVTVGNSCQVTDGAVAVLLMSEAAAASHGLEPMGSIKSYAYAGCDPTRMGLGPVFASNRALRDAGTSLDQMALVELNEVFAAQVLACEKAFGSATFAKDNLGGAERVGELPMDRLNVNGGAIALGHPVGATGARLVLTLLHELKRRGEALGLATLCVGGGQGGAIVVEANAS